MTFEIENVSKTFVSNDSEEEVLALKDINLTIETGKFVSFVGPSGCGKTTLLRIIEGFENPTSGTVKDDGEIVTEPSNERGFIFQNYSLYPWLNVIENVIFGLDINGKPEKESRERAMEYLEAVGLKDFAKRYPHELSGGMKQRVAIIRSIINDSKNQYKSLMSGKSNKVEYNIAKTQTETIEKQFEQCAAQTTVRIKQAIQYSFNSIISNVISQYLNHLNKIGIRTGAIHLGSYNGVRIQTPDFSNSFDENTFKISFLETSFILGWLLMYFFQFS